jgi:hypothetical protein
MTIPIIGPVVGTATYNGGSSLNSFVDFTLTGPIASTTPGFRRGMVWAVASQEPTATAAVSFGNSFQRNCGVLTSLDHTDFTAPYSAHRALEKATNNNALIMFSYRSVSGTTYEFRGMWAATAYQTFHIGDQMRFRMDSTAFSAPIEWWSMNLHSCEFPPANNEGYIGAITGGNGSFFTVNNNIFPLQQAWQGLMTASLTTLDDSFIINRLLLNPGFNDTTPLTYNLTRTGVFRSAYAWRDITPATSPAPALYTVFSSLNQNYGAWLGMWNEAFPPSPAPNYNDMNITFEYQQ